MIQTFETIQMRVKDPIKQYMNARILNQNEAKQVSDLACAALLLSALPVDDGDSAALVQDLLQRSSHRVMFGLWCRFAGEHWEDGFIISTATTKYMLSSGDIASNPLRMALLHSPNLHRKSQRPLLNGKQLMEIGNIPQGAAVGRGRRRDARRPNAPANLIRVRIGVHFC